MSKAPAYQMYARDWLASRSVRFMTDYQRGWYIQLLNEAWDSDPQCMLPDDDEILQRMAGVSDIVRAIPDFNDRWTTVRRMFKQHGQYVCNERQMEEFAAQQLRREQASLAGKSSAAKRADALKLIKDKHFADSTTVERPLNDRCDSVQRKSNTATATASADCNLQASPVPPRAGKPALLYRWDEFAAIYPADKLVPDAKAKGWWRKHMTSDLLVNDLLAATRTWVSSRQYQDGFGFGACRFLTEGVWKTMPKDTGTHGVSHIQDVPAGRRPAAYKPFELPPEPQDEAPILSLRDVSETARRRLGGSQ